MIGNFEKEQLDLTLKTPPLEPWETRHPLVKKTEFKL